MAFEVFDGNKSALFISKSADVWAFAMVVIIEVRGNVTKGSFILLIKANTFINREPI